MTMPKNDVRRNRFVIFLTDDEDEYLRRLIDASRLSASAYIRMRLFDGRKIQPNDNPS